MIIKSEVSTFPIVVNFFHGWVLVVHVASCTVGFIYIYTYIYVYIYIFRDSWIFCLSLLCSRMMCANNRVHYDPMVVFVCLLITLHHYHHYVRNILPRSVCLRLSHFSQLSFMQYMGLCVFSLPMSLVMIVSTSILSYLILSYLILSYHHHHHHYHHQIGSMAHLPLSKVR